MPSKSAAPSRTAVASKAAATQSPEDSDPAYNVETVTLICLTDGGEDPSANLTGDVCADILDATLAALGARASSVVRAEVGFVCAAADRSCTDDAIVGFKDGHLEGANVDWQQEDAPFEVGAFHALPATAWPWGPAAAYKAPQASLPTLAIAPSPELAKRTPLPYCGLLTADDATTTAGAERCFGDAVRTGHAAEIDTEFGNDPYAETVDRFVGSGPIVETTGRLPANRKGGSWNAGTTPILIIVDPDGSISFAQFEVTDVSPVE